MSRILFALLCSIAINAQAIVMTPDQPSGSASSKPAAHAVHVKSAARISAVPVEKPVPLPILSKASTGFCQAFHYSQNPNYDMMDLYLQQGADINAFCNSDYRLTALYSALSNSNYQLADWLIQRGADVNIPADWSSQGGAQETTLAMLVAGKTKDIPDLKLLDYLIQHGASMKRVDKMGRTALHWFNGWSFVGYPINTGSPNLSAQTISFIEKLIGQGIDINLQDKSGSTALMNAVVSFNQRCSSEAVKLLLSHGANPALKNKLDKSALDLAIDRATQAGQGDQCNEVVKILSKSPQASRATSTSSYANTNQSQQDVAVYADTYAGTFSGSDYGIFQATISQDGTAYLSGRSEKHGVAFTGEGKISSDGTITMGSVSTGTEFTGSVNASGVLSGGWKNTAYNLSGSFQGQKGTTNAAATPKPLDAVGNIFGILGTILKPQ